jgi:hypothetical protein
MGRRRHPHRHIEAAIAYAESHGWRVRVAGARAHAWGVMFCPHNDAACRAGDFCVMSINGTPGNPEWHARTLRRVVDGCTAGRQTPSGG